MNGKDCMFEILVMLNFNITKVSNRLNLQNDLKLFCIFSIRYVVVALSVVNEFRILA